MDTESVGINLSKPCTVGVLQQLDKNSSFHCRVCSKKVIDFRHKSQQQLIREMPSVVGSACGMFYQHQVQYKGRMFRLGAGLVLLLGMQLVSQQSMAQPPDTVHAAVVDTSSVNSVVGTFEVMPVCKHEDLNAFIRNRLVYPDTVKVSGRVVVSFTVDTLGLVKNIKVVRPLHPLIDQEVMRVCTLLEFSPGYVNGRPVETRMFLPIKFE